MKNIKLPSNAWVIKYVNGINFSVDLYLRNYLDFIFDEFSFENLYYLSKKRKTRGKSQVRRVATISYKTIYNKKIYQLSEIANCKNMSFHRF